MGTDEDATDGTAGGDRGDDTAGADRPAGATGSDPSDGDEAGPAGREDAADAPGSESTAGPGETYEVFVQWRRGKPHEHAETVNAPDADMALLLAKRNVDVRSGPVSIMVAPRAEMRETAPGDTTLVPSTDRDYRNVAGYAGDEGGEP